MFKTLTVSIGKIPFIIEEQAYAVLDAYLTAIRAHFASTADQDEIVSDIESRMAEEFGEALGKQRKVIESADVDAVIAAMGTVEDFRTFDEGQAHETTESNSPFKKVRLYRDADNQIIGGVCAGIANYFAIDPIIVRLAFGLSVFLGGFGVVLYVVLWIALPEARTTAQKVEMTGGRVTLAAIQKKIDAVVPPEKRKNIIARTITFPFHIIGMVIRFILQVLSMVLPLLGRVAGAFVSVGAAFAIAGCTFVLFALLLNPHSPYIGLPLQDAIGATAFTALLLCAYFVAFLPILLALLIGISLVLMRNVLSVASVIALTVLWFAAGTAGATTVFSVAPQLEPILAEYDETTEQSYDFKNFTGVAGSSIQRIVVTRGDAYSVVLEGSERAQAIHEPIVEDGILSVQTMPDHDPCMFFCHSRNATLRVTMPRIASVTAEDASRMILEGFSGSAMTIATQDIGRVDVESSFTDLTVTMKDASSVELRGGANTLTATLQDVSHIDAKEFVVQHATVTTTDASSVSLDVRQSLNGSASDVSSIRYVTTPATLDVTLSDHARIRGDDEDMDEYDDENY